MIALILFTLRDLLRPRHDLIIDNLALRQQILLLERAGALWCLALPVMVPWRHGPVRNVPDSTAPIIIGIVGMLAIVGCARGLRQRM